MDTIWLWTIYCGIGGACCELCIVYQDLIFSLSIVKRIQRVAAEEKKVLWGARKFPKSTGYETVEDASPLEAHELSQFKVSHGH